MTVVAWLTVFVMVVGYTVVVPPILVVVEVTTGMLIKLEQKDAAFGYRCKTLTTTLTSLHALAGGRIGFGKAETAVHSSMERENLDSMLRGEILDSLIDSSDGNAFNSFGTSDTFQRMWKCCGRVETVYRRRMKTFISISVFALGLHTLEVIRWLNKRR